MDDQQSLLRHLLAALAYRTQKALRGAPDDFGSFFAGTGVRTPAELLRHMTSVLGYARTFFIRGRYWPDPLPTLGEEIVRFHGMVGNLAHHGRGIADAAVVPVSPDKQWPEAPDGWQPQGARPA